MIQGHFYLSSEDKLLKIWLTVDMVEVGLLLKETPLVSSILKIKPKSNISQKVSSQFSMQEILGLAVGN